MMISCTHCDEQSLVAIFSDEDINRNDPFCCYGCLTVYKIIHQKGLSDYYEIKKNASFFKRRSPVELKNIQYQYLDDPDFLKEFSYENLYHEKTMEFYLEGIHCLACLWLIEKLSEIIPNIKSVKVNLERSVAIVSIGDNGKFADVAFELNQLGYRPHPLKNNQESNQLKINEEKSMLTKIGVAGAASGNIMMYAISLYAGADQRYAYLFNALTVLFAIPVLFYSAIPFYKNSWNAIKNKTVSIDVPISIALIMGAIMGFYNLLVGIPENYFDSLTALVFLLLLSRYFLQKIQEKGLSAQDLHYFYQGESVLKLDETKNEYIEIHPKFIKVADLIKIKPDEFIPADGVIISGESNLNCSLLTGESRPQKVSNGDAVFSGTQNLDHELIIKITSIKNTTKLGQILKNVENGWSLKNSFFDLTNRISKYFILVVFTLSALVFTYFTVNGENHRAFEMALTLLIVTCPCALAIATPLMMTRALTKAAQQGIIIKNNQVIEKILQVKTIFLDKTGTVTFGKLNVVEFKILSSMQVRVKDVIYHLEKKSKHPVAHALMDYIKGKEITHCDVQDFRENLGRGVSAKINGVNYEITQNSIFENEKRVATFKLDDVIRPDSKSSIDYLRSQGIQINMLTGDQSDLAHKIATEAGIEGAAVYPCLLPEDKSRIVESTSYSMMVGDGANDAIALSHAEVGVAVMGAMDISLRAADVYLSTPGLEPVVNLFILSRETMKVIYRNLILSLAYNSLSVIAVFLGIINPLIAAIIMPLSSLTVLISTLVGTKKLRAMWK